MEVKTILIFLPQRFTFQQYGCIYGSMVYDYKSRISKFYVIDLKESARQRSGSPDNKLTFLGFLHSKKSKQDYWGKKLANWIEIYPSSSDKKVDQEYCLKNIIIQNQKLSVSCCHTVIILYNEVNLLKAELFSNKNKADHFAELRTIISKECSHRNQEELQQLFNARIRELIFVSILHVISYPVKLLCILANLFYPILKYSVLGLHLHAWCHNLQWTLSSLLKFKKFTISITNYIIAIILDMLLGQLFLKALLHFLKESSPSEVYLYYAENVVESLKGLVHWLMGSPAGLKLNPPFNGVLGKFFLYHIHLWWVFLMVTKPLMEFAFKILLFFGQLGVTFHISIIADLLALVSFHTYCIYVYAARLFNIQVRGLTALFRLFLGKKKNPLRMRVDTCRYQPDQLFVGTLLFTILLFLMPTTWVYYIVFTLLRLVMISFGGLLTRLKFHLQILPVYVFFHWFFQTVNSSGSIGIVLQKRRAGGPITLTTRTVRLTWSETWRKSIPDTISIYPPIEWYKIASNVFWGQLLYPL